ncbi:MAG: restriction endonuclease subunit S [Streptococcus salivarius]|nr:restriction endonuclease subunit S [Streptococcus salivarius]
MTRMKESGIDWIGQIPEEWEVKGIKHIFEEIGSGTTPKSDNETFYDGDINWIQSGDLYQTDEVIKVSKTITYQGFQSTSALKIYQQPFIALAMYGASVGNVAISCIDACVNQAVVVMLGTSEKVRFGKYAIEASKNNLIFSAQGGTQPNISQNLIKNWNIPQPDSSEQTKIADFLDKKTAQLDKVKALLEEQIQKLKDYRASLIYETVTKGLDKTVPVKDSGIDWIGQVPQGWGVKAIKYIFDEIGSGSTPKSDNEIFYDGDINWIQSGDLYQTDTVMSVSKTISYQGFKSTSALKIYQPPFVALAMYGASVGNVAVSYIDACVNQAVVVMLGTSEKVRFGKYAIEASKNNLVFSAQGGTQPNISQNLIKNWSIPQPKNEEQEQIVDFLDKKTVQIEKLIQIKNQQIENVNKQRQTLIYDYVTGKSRV